VHCGWLTVELRPFLSFLSSSIARLLKDIFRTMYTRTARLLWSKIEVKDWRQVVGDSCGGEEGGREFKYRTKIGLNIDSLRRQSIARHHHHHQQQHLVTAEWRMSEPRRGVANLRRIQSDVSELNWTDMV